MRDALIAPLFMLALVSSMAAAIVTREPGALFAWPVLAAIALKVAS